MPEHDPLDTRTRTAAPRRRLEMAQHVPALTVLSHPDLSRVGDRVVLTDLLGGKAVELSRKTPLFAPVRHGDPQPLADAYLSRQPLVLRREPTGGIVLERDPASPPLFVDGAAVGPQYVVASAGIDDGVILNLADRVVLALHRFELLPPTSAASNLIGESSAINRVRHDIERVADLDFPVLLRGESGTGKELAARAIHNTGPRRHEPFLATNVGAIPKELAAAELFGAAKGAFTGALKARPGFFTRAGRGSLFLDEIGTAAPEIQMLLLRVLESGEIQPVGDSPRHVEARVISATDANLDAAVGDGDFHSPLLHRLSAYEITLPPLRTRKEDFGRLFLYFLQAELADMGETERLQGAGDDEPWVPAELIANLARHAWPGNVRQLRNVVRQLAVASRGQHRLTVPPRVAQMLDEPVGKPSVADTDHASRVAGIIYRNPESVSEDELLEALRTESFHISRAAARLGLSKASVYRLVDQNPKIRKASELDTEEITRALEEAAGDVDQAAHVLAVSSRGLRLRMHALHIKP